MQVNDRSYRPNVGIVLCQNNLIFLGKRLDCKNMLLDEKVWQMPQGGIDEGESPLQAALRELKEEIGTDNVKVLKSSGTWYTYDFPNNLSKKAWNGMFKGQCQKWFLMEFLGDINAINLQTEHPEFCEFFWATKKEVLERVVSFKYDIYQQVFDELLPENR